MVARSRFSHKECENKNIPELHEMLHGIGVNWTTDYTDGMKNGRIICKETEYVEKMDVIQSMPSAGTQIGWATQERTRWVVNACGVFTQNPKEITDLIPARGYE